MTADVLEAERRAQVSRAGAGFHGIAVAPFVVVAYGPTYLREDAVQTIVWARDALRRDFFASEPGEPLTVWIFPDEETYMRETSAVLGIVPSTPYGFYRPCSKALVVNSGYGWGTLVHEMVHAYMDADFPNARVWVQEGLASLFEAPEPKMQGDRDDRAPTTSTSEAREAPRIRGAVNWRLSALQVALESGRAPSFHRTAKASRGDFDGKDGYLYYATSRYLLYWLQEQGLLRRFYAAYREGSRRDPDGLETLRHVSGRELSSLRIEWEAFVRGLVYTRPRS